MFKKKTESYDDYEKRMDNRADILFPTMAKNKESNKSPKAKNLPLGKLVYDDDEEKSSFDTKNLNMEK